LPRLAPYAQTEFVPRTLASNNDGVYQFCAESTPDTACVGTHGPLEAYAPGPLEVRGGSGLRPEGLIACWRTRGSEPPAGGGASSGAVAQSLPQPGCSSTPTPEADWRRQRQISGTRFA
jgi:hypothetical protein